VTRGAREEYEHLGNDDAIEISHWGGSALEARETWIRTSSGLHLRGHIFGATKR
jgi:hypothetical protein